MMELLERLFNRNSSQPSGKEAKQRLKLIIAHDRSGLSEETVETMRQEILEVVARYVEIDLDSTEISLENEEGITALIANLPIRRVKQWRFPPAMLLLVIRYSLFVKGTS